MLSFKVRTLIQWNACNGGLDRLWKSTNIFEWYIASVSIEKILKSDHLKTQDIQWLLYSLTLRMSYEDMMVLKKLLIECITYRIIDISPELIKKYDEFESRDFAYNIILRLSYADVRTVWELLSERSHKLEKLNY